jgi:hypothetical protein
MINTTGEDISAHIARNNSLGNRGIEESIRLGLISEPPNFPTNNSIDTINFSDVYNHQIHDSLAMQQLQRQQQIIPSTYANMYMPTSVNGSYLHQPPHAISMQSQSAAYPHIQQNFISPSIINNQNPFLPTPNNSRITLQEQSPYIPGDFNNQSMYTFAPSISIKSQPNLYASNNYLSNGNNNFLRLHGYTSESDESEDGDPPTLIAQKRDSSVKRMKSRFKGGIFFVCLIL